LTPIPLWMYGIAIVSALGCACWDELFKIRYREQKAMRIRKEKKFAYDKNMKEKLEIAVDLLDVARQENKALRDDVRELKVAVGRIEENLEETVI